MQCDLLNKIESLNNPELLEDIRDRVHGLSESEAKGVLLEMLDDCSYPHIRSIYSVNHPLLDSDTKILKNTYMNHILSVYLRLSKSRTNKGV